MPRIRTVKPEFADSESMGRVSRDARLLFVIMWTIADDAGRLRGAARYLASRAFPYDVDAPGLVDGWLAELEREDCITRYVADGSSYIAITHWTLHQRIEKPSESKLPALRTVGEDSPTAPGMVAEPSPPRARALEVDQGVGIDLEVDQEQPTTGTADAAPTSKGNGATPLAADWTPFYADVADHWTQTPNTKDGKLRAWVGQFAFMVGKFVGTDVSEARRLFRKWADSPESKYAQTPTLAPDKWGKWLQSTCRFDVGVQR